MIQTQETTVCTQRVPPSPNTTEQQHPPPDRARDGRQATEKRCRCPSTKRSPGPAALGPRQQARPSPDRHSLSLPCTCLPNVANTVPRTETPNVSTAERSETPGAAETLTRVCDSGPTGGRKTSSGKRRGDPGRKALSSTRHFFRVQTTAAPLWSKKKGNSLAEPKKTRCGPSLQRNRIQP